MMKQYHEMKSKYPDAILFFRLGDFYEMFFEDAIEASQLLQITLTARNKGENKAPMCGIPYHAANNYIGKLTRLGKKVAICEQLSDPNLPGIVNRDVIRVITPGTTLDDNILDQKTNNYVLAILENGNSGVPVGGGANDASPANGAGFSLAYADITTGEFMTTAIESVKELFTEIQRIGPTEIIVGKNLFESELIQSLKKSGDHSFIYQFESDKNVDADSMESTAADFLMAYLKSTQKTSLQHFQKIQPYDIADFMPLDEATLKNLELLTTMRENKKEGSLLWVIDRTITSMGGRLIRFFLTHPLVKKEQIQLRLDAVETFTRNQNLLGDLREILKSILDLERLLARLSLGQGNARDLVGLKNSLSAVPQIQNLLGGGNAILLRQISDGIDPLQDLVELIGKAIVTEPPLAITDGGMIADGYNNELDDLKKISREGKQFIQKLQEEEIQRTGINTLKVRFNSVFGYYIEVSKAQSKNVPMDYIRKQTLVNAERFITPQLKEFEEKVLGAEEKIVAIEQKLFQEIRGQVVEHVARIQHTAKSIALLDVLCSFAFAALENNFCKPQISEPNGDTVGAGCEIKIVGGRHPVVEKMSSNASFVSNDTMLESGTLILLTGPNMGGKSTYLRQVALITLLAQIGSFVPAAEAKIGLVDRIFTRVGASDNLMRGQSTFMVEMQETANILSNATSRSLVILDEIGRGTSTYDGMSIAWAIMEYLHDKIGAKTLFATHYHELIALAEKLPHAANFSVAVKEEESVDSRGIVQSGIVFLYKILPGGVDRSYGIEVAKLAGLPTEIIAKARQILVDLEEGVLEQGIQKELNDPTKRVTKNQLGIFENGSEDQIIERQQKSLASHPALEDLKKMDINNLTPMEALKVLKI